MANWGRSWAALCCAMWIGAEASAAILPGEQVLFADDFTSATAPDNGLGPSWALTGLWFSTGSVAVADFNGTNRARVIGHACAECRVEALVLGNGASQTGVLLRSSSTLDRYELMLLGNGNLRLRRWRAGSVTTLAEVPSGVALNQWSTLSLRASGAGPVMLIASVNGATKISLTDTSAQAITLSGSAGIFTNTAGVAFDTFRLYANAPVADAGTPDAGSASDAGVPPDAGTPKPDGGSIGDAGSPAPDAGTLGNVLVNGDFERASLTGWSASGITSITSSAAHNGSYAAQLGSANPSTDSSLRQSFVVPSVTPNLSFWYRISCPDSLRYDWATVQLTNAAGTVLATPLAKTCSNDGTWRTVSLDLSPYAGQTLTLVLANHDDNYPGDPTFTLYDDVVVSGGPVSAGTCLSSALANWARKPLLWDGADLSDAPGVTVAIDVRMQFIAGGYSSGGICASCGGSCNPDWWGCWQDVTQPPGAFVRSYASNARSLGEVPYLTYYELLQASGVAEGSAEVRIAANDPTFMKRYFDDFRFFLQQLGGAAMVHLEPDFWGYAEQLSANPHTLAAAVASANPTDCATQENSIAGMGRCLIAMVRKYAPSARVGLHASEWSTGFDVLLNSSASVDVAAEARKTAAFLQACGGDQADFVALDVSDRDAGYYSSIGKNTWWDATNATLPNFHQAFAWEKALTAALGKPGVWFMTPFGNMSLPNVDRAWQDNRLDYFFAHPAELVQANSFAFVFGAGDSHQTNASTDGNHFVTTANGYAGHGPPLCP